MKNFKFGCEFEFSSGWEEVKHISTEAINKYYGPRHLFAQHKWFRSTGNTRKWHLKTDNTTECELCTPISTQNSLNKICSVINYLGHQSIKVSKNDSFHVHMSAHGIDPRKIVAAWLSVEKTILRCFPKHRRQRYDAQGTYCAQLTHKNNKKNIAGLLEQAIYIAEEHESALSLHYYGDRGTAEFRVGEGTTDPKFVKNWVLFCMKFLQYASKIDPFDVLCQKTENMGITEMINIMNIRNKNIEHWLYGRYKDYN